MRNATSIGLFGASALALTILGACGGGGGSHDDGASGSGNSTAGTNPGTAGTNPGTAGTNPGTAGTTGTAGAGTAGSGTGGAASCTMAAGPKSGDGMNTTIDEIDDTNIMFSPAGTGMGAWDFGKDNGAMAMGTITPTGTTTLMPVTGGHMGNALHVTGTGLTGWGASLAAFLNGATGAFDASSYGGVAFWIKGTTDVQEGMNKLMIQARMPDVLPGPGSCCNDATMGMECYSGHRTIIDVPTDWAEVKIPWSAFMGPAWGLGSTIPLNPNRIRDINFSFNHDTMMKDKPASFDVWVDGLRFMKKDEMGNVGGGMGGSGGGSAGGGGGTGGASGGASSGGGGNGGTGGTN